MQREILEVLQGFLVDQRFDGFPRQYQLIVLAAKFGERGNRFVAEEPILLLQCADEHVDRFLVRDHRQRPRNVAAHPQVLVLVAHEMSERVDDRRTVADEHRPRARFQPAIAQQRDQGRDEHVVVRTSRSDAFHGLVCDVGRRIVEQRDQQMAEPRVGNLSNRDGDVAPGPAGILSRVARELEQCGLRGIDIGWAGTARQRDRRRGADSRLRVLEQRTRQRGGILLADRDEGADGCGANAGLRISEHPANLRRPLTRDVAADCAQRRERTRPDLRRLVIQQQRCHEIALVERFEHVNRVDDPARFGMRQLLHQRFNGRQLRTAQPHVVRLDHALFDAATERGQVFPLRAERHDVPDPRQRDADPAELIPGQREPPGLNEGEHAECADAARQPIDRDIDERLDFLAQLAGQREEQDFARRLVDRVAEGPIHDARDGGCPEHLEGQDECGRDGQVRRQDQQREPNPQVPVNARRDPDLDDECRCRQPEPDLGEETADRIFLAGAFEYLGRHVQLLVDQHRADRTEADDDRDELNLGGSA